MSARAHSPRQLRTASVLLAAVVLAASGILGLLGAPRVVPAQDIAGHAILTHRALVATGTRTVHPSAAWKLPRADTPGDTQLPLGTWAVLPGVVLLAATAAALSRQRASRGRTPRPTSRGYPQRGPPLTRPA